MKRNLLIIVILCLSFVFTACGSFGNDKLISENYERGYNEGYSAGLSDKQSEWDKWWEDKYYYHEVVESEDSDEYIKHAFAVGLILGYEARNNKLNLVGIDRNLSGHEYDDAREILLGQFSLEDDNYNDHLIELFDEVYPKIIEGS